MRLKTVYNGIVGKSDKKHLISVKRLKRRFFSLSEHISQPIISKKLQSVLLPPFAYIYIHGWYAHLLKKMKERTKHGI